AGCRSLRAGDMVDTLDGGPCPVRWVRSRHQRLEGLEDAHRPVLIQRDALGAGRPLTDLIVSPQHRILVGGAGQLTRLFGSDVLVPAKALTALAGVRHMRGRHCITWVHIALDQHHIVCANGLFAETLYLGPMVVRDMSPTDRAAFALNFGTTLPDGAALNGPPARAFWTVAATRRHLRQAGERTRLGNRMATHAF
ncbi:MAG: Hint domain-containing protein, partial [Pseudomonadota bacterium]